MNKYELPPIGVKPRLIHDEERLIELSTVIGRCISNGDFPIALEWVQEYNEIIDRVCRRRVLNEKDKV